MLLDWLIYTLVFVAGYATGREMERRKDDYPPLRQLQSRCPGCLQEGACRDDCPRVAQDYARLDERRN